MQIFNKHNGFTLLEVTVSILLLGGLALISNTIITKVRSVATESDSTMFNSTNLGLGITALSTQLNQSALMRSGFINCSGSTVLKSKELNDGGIGIELKQDKDQFSFVYSKYQSIAVSHPEIGGSLVVPDPAYFPIGSLVMLSSLDNNQEKGIYKVINNESHLKLEATEEIPIEYNCSLGSNILDPLSQIIAGSNEKFAIANIKVIRYFVQEEHQRTINGITTPKLNLMASEWPISKSNYIMVEDFNSFNLSQDFITTGMTYGNSDTGQYIAKGTILYNKKIGTSLQKIEGVISSTYAIEGIITPNFRAVATPTVDEDIAKPTCMIEFRKINANFKIGDEVIYGANGTYRIYAKYTAADYLNEINVTPTITISSSDNTSYCYREDKIECKNEAFLNKITETGGPKLAFPIVLNKKERFTTSCLNLTEEERQTILFTNLCFFKQDNTSLVAEMRYQAPTKSGETITNTVSCSVGNTIRVEDIDDYTYVYKNDNTTCTRDGDISLGQLVKKDNPESPGPQLSIKKCTWTTGHTGCNPKAAFLGSFSTKLNKIELIPEVDIEYNSRTINCND